MIVRNHLRVLFLKHADDCLISDYDTFYIASKEITAQQIETATKILELAEQYLLVEEKQQDKH